MEKHTEFIEQPPYFQPVFEGTRYLTCLRLGNLSGSVLGTFAQWSLRQALVLVPELVLSRRISLDSRMM